MVTMMQTTYQVPVKFCTNAERRMFWCKILADQNTSGMSMKKFCRLHQLKYSTFKGYKYRKQNAENTIDDIENNNVKRKSNTAKFIPLQITNDALISKTKCSKSENKVSDSNLTEIKIIFNNGNKIFVPQSISEASWLLLIKIISELKC